LATLVGAIPGAVPPLIGWAAARGTITVDAGILYAVLFPVAIPALRRHFPGCTGKTTVARESRCWLWWTTTGSGRSVKSFLTACVALARQPASGSDGPCRGALLFLGRSFWESCSWKCVLWAAAAKSNVRAKWLMHATVLHLPLLLGLLLLRQIFPGNFIFWRAPRPRPGRGIHCKSGARTRPG